MSRTVWVQWVDSATLNPSWNKVEEIDGEECLCYSTGWIVKKTKHTIWLASDSSPTQHGRIIQIPKCAIRKKKKLKAK